MTSQEEKEIIRVCGPDYDYWDIPPEIRQREENQIEAEERMAEEIGQQ